MFLFQHPALLLILTTTLFETLTYLDLSTLQLLNGNRATDLDFLLLTLTISAYGLGACVPLYLYLVGHFKKVVSLKLKAYQYVFAMGLNILFIGLLKYTVDRPRPFVTHDTIEQIAEASSPSFPSGHTAYAFTAAIMLVLMFRHPLLRGLLLTWALLVAYSRLALGVHYPSDVLGSMLLGSAAAFLSTYAFRKHREQFFALLKRSRNLRIMR
ncbi:phosphatase PAP2 family protein [Pontibacter ramchanderi]|uniref:Membrane-associated phospholipid phosphatase n=1 Tax=Pontibacter ramchanderi TaxID=1179743 RepID=A0A2N3V344_9BACT|nr:phosphatase PAP2 family protein [Pontibacter ramchanderi]PKV76049.1 membrane-associated phospholipid phosphatase [Pontibacter ramchanderi]